MLVTLHCECVSHTVSVIVMFSASYSYCQPKIVTKTMLVTYVNYIDVQLEIGSIELKTTQKLWLTKTFESSTNHLSYRKITEGQVTFPKHI